MEEKEANYEFNDMSISRTLTFSGRPNKISLSGSRDVNTNTSI